MSAQPKAIKVPNASRPHKFFSLNGTYLIAPDVRAIDLVNDASCILEASRAGVQALIDGIGDEGSQMSSNPKDAVALLFGVLYQLEMVSNIVAGMPFPAQSVEA